MTSQSSAVPALPEWAADSTERADLGALIAYHLVYALEFVAMRTMSHEQGAQVQARVVAKHHERDFLDAISALGLDAEPSDAIRCAKFHCLTNVLARIPMAYFQESTDKAWIVYLPPIGGPFGPGIGAGALTDEYEFLPFLAWHARNGTTLGNPRLQFVVTHTIANGDGVTAAYFAETDRILEHGERMRVALGSERLPPFEPYLLDPSDWSAERIARSGRKAAIGFLGGQLGSLAAQIGVEPAAAMWGDAVSAVLFHETVPWLERLDVPSDSPHRAALVLHRLLDALGDTVSLSCDVGGGVVLERSASRLHKEPDISEFIGGFPRRFDEVFDQAFQRYATYLDRSCRLISARSDEDDAGRAQWTFVSN